MFGRETSVDVPLSQIHKINDWFYDKIGFMCLKSV
jgi:hypothetical protein